MPQFDTVTFFNQIIWFLILFFSFYFILLKNYLPKIATVLKARKKIALMRSLALEESSKNGLTHSEQKLIPVLVSLQFHLDQLFKDGQVWNVVSFKNQTQQTNSLVEKNIVKISSQYFFLQKTLESLQSLRTTRGKKKKSKKS
jgi:hypothetical protein